MYPVFLAKHFKKVLTFEPQDINFYCLQQNIKKTRNVNATNAALGNSNQPVSLKGWAPNCGAYEINGFGAIEQIRIDDLKLDEVDFIQLDVQGYEDKVLKGAEQTLKRCAPVLMLEEGWGPNVANYLHELRYTPVENSTNKGRVRDTIYIKA